MGPFQTLINNTPGDDGGNIDQLLSEMSTLPNGGTQVQQSAQSALQTAWSAWITARQAAMNAFVGQ